MKELHIIFFNANSLIKLKVILHMKSFLLLNKAELTKQSSYNAFFFKFD